MKFAEDYLKPESSELDSMDNYLERIYFTIAMEIIHAQKWKRPKILIVEDWLEKIETL